MRALEKPKYEFEPQRITRLLEYTATHEAQEVVESLIDTYCKAKKEVMRIYEKEKMYSGVI